MDIQAIRLCQARVVLKLEVSEIEYLIIMSLMAISSPDEDIGGGVSFMPRHLSDSSRNLLCSDIYVSHQLKLFKYFNLFQYAILKLLYRKCKSYGSCQSSTTSDICRPRSDIQLRRERKQSGESGLDAF